MSGDSTWEKDEYAVTWYSSRSPFGPFEYGGVIIAPSDDIGAPGQNWVGKIDDEWHFVCHGVDMNDPYIGEDEHRQFKRVPYAARLNFPAGKPELERY